ncbi:nucleotidyltransferase [Algoriphagus sp. D3-2-R+10]|uniref:nucleotidyltransferase n=1 Tax=Algoriphagus aurantiacus TaxID=3103948 RepID=UPI002B3A7644|nr:nucleotidyltransferase [Algoriphagus sp. D3-2-R+10]MEB2776762.1 nucleotidyltransferase [Algoriphagus sp. D3-2-R+10]
MGNIFEDDFRDFLKALNHQEVDYILVGAFSVIIHGYARTTGDMDLWVRKTENNYKKLVDAFYEFGMPVFDMTLENFLNHPDWDVFSFGKSPVAIDIMTAVRGLDFNKTFEQAKIFDDDGLKVRTIHKNDLIKAKTASNRPKDQDDLDNLQ